MNLHRFTEHTPSDPLSSEIRRIRRGAAEAMQAARERGDHDAWEQIWIRSQWAIDDLNREFRNARQRA